MDNRTQEQPTTSTAEESVKLLPVNFLLVDDKEENLISLESILEREGRTILKARNGNEALKMALENEIALILLDVQMPDIDGFEVARLLRSNSRTKEINIIFVTAISKEEKFTIQGYQEGAVDYLHKPFDMNVVKAKVDVFEKLYRQRIDLVNTNQKLNSLNAQLNEFVYIVSHDLKAPLRGLSSISDFLEEELGSEIKPGIAGLLKLMRSRTGRMQQLIDGVLHYSWMSNSKADKEPTDLKELINNIIDLICPPSNIRIEYPDALPEIHVERVKLHEVLQNLISNAIKHNPNVEGYVKIGFQDRDDHYEFTVSDNGCGIRAEYHDKIFGLFQTLQPKDKTENSGLGLTIVKKLVEQQNGKVTVHSVWGEGSTFRFTWKK